jgi:hypothetical protein
VATEKVSQIQRAVKIVKKSLAKKYSTLYEKIQAEFDVLKQLV